MNSKTVLRNHVKQDISFGFSDRWLLRPSFFYFLFYRFFLKQVRVRGRNKNKIHSDHFPIELKSKETQIVFPSILIQLENEQNEFYFY